LHTRLVARCEGLRARVDLDLVERIRRRRFRVDDHPGEDPAGFLLNPGMARTRSLRRPAEAPAPSDDEADFLVENDAADFTSYLSG